MISNWTFDATGRNVAIHATVKKTGGSCYSALVWSPTAPAAWWITEQPAA